MHAFMRVALWKVSCFYLDLLKIKDPSFMKRLDIQELEALAADIRAFLITSTSKSGGHIGPNLGVVELTIRCIILLIVQKINLFGMLVTSHMCTKS